MKKSVVVDDFDRGEGDSDDDSLPPTTCAVLAEYCKQLAQNKVFNMIMVLLILISAINLGLETDKKIPRDSKGL